MEERRYTLAIGGPGIFQSPEKYLWVRTRMVAARSAVWKGRRLGVKPDFSAVGTHFFRGILSPFAASREK
jgi:hypothetical protein